MSTTILEEALAGKARIVPWTVEAYDAAIARGQMREDAALELIDGFIVQKDRAKSGDDPMTVGDRHALVVQRMIRLAASFDPLGAHLRIQQPIAIPPLNEPEPDAAVVRGHEDDYMSRRPAPADVSCVIEVADSSLDRDLGTKLRVYATAGIGQYVVIDLIGGRVLVHHQPANGTYSIVKTLSPTDTLSINAGRGNVDVALARLLP